MMIPRIPRIEKLVGVLVCALALAACGGDSNSGSNAPAPAGSAGAGGATGRIGGTVSVLATWGGNEQEAFLAMVKPFEDRTGIRVQYEGTRDLNAILTTRVNGNNPPDLAGLPGPGQMAEFSRSGRLIDLGSVLDRSAMQNQYSDDWMKLAQVDGKQAGIFIKTALKGAVWYNPDQFSKVNSGAPPATWDELIALSNRIAEGGATPWCIGLESGAASGWPGTDWIENIVLRQSGPDVYDKWAQGQQKWSSPEIRRAFETWGQIVANDKMVFGGRQGMLATNFGDAGNALFTNPPRCTMYQQGSFITDFFKQNNPNLQPGSGYTFFPFPRFDQANAGATEIAGDLFGMFRDTPQSRALIQYLTTPEAQEIWVRRGGALSPNKLVPLSAYPDDISRQMAQTLTTASNVRFDASDLMPEAMNNAFWRAILDYVQNPSNLGNILSTLDRVQSDAYRR